MPFFHLLVNNQVIYLEVQVLPLPLKPNAFVTVGDTVLFSKLRTAVAVGSIVKVNTNQNLDCVLHLSQKQSSRR